jgi:hypothetical protein
MCAYAIRNYADTFQILQTIIVTHYFDRRYPRTRLCFLRVCVIGVIHVILWKGFTTRLTLEGGIRYVNTKRAYV